MKHKLFFFLFLQSFLFFILPNLECKERLKILVVVEMFPCAIQTFVLNQIIGLIDKGHDVWIFAKKKWKIDLPLPEIEKYGLLKKIYYDVVPINLDSFDIIYCQFAHISHDFVELKKANKRPWKLVVAFRGYDSSAILKQNPHVYDDLFKIGDLFLPVCKYFKNILIDAGCDLRKIRVHHSAIDCTEFAFQFRKKNHSIIHIVTTARLVKEKGVEIALEAIFNLLKQGQNIKYTIIGDGPLKKIFNKKIVNSGYTNRIQILGYVSHAEVCKVLSTADIFMLVPITTKNNILEGIPNSLMEAMALGIPVISSYHSGIPELIIDGVSGFLVPEYDIHALVDKLKYMIIHHELWPIFSFAGRNYVERKHNIILTNNYLEQMFINLCKNKS